MGVVRVNHLPLMDAGGTEMFLANSNGETKQIGMDSIISFVKKSIGIYDNVLKKCKHCGQWGAVMCACPHCGAPIDPE